jgi:hypothetical protein
MFVGYSSSYTLLLSWLLIFTAIIWLPKLIKRAGLTDAIDARMQNTIRGVLIAYLLLNLLVFLAGFIVSYLTGLVLWLHL